jgi:cytochrome c biogenesis protein CcdA/thiol-disulfide isomerase/thioredoxin
MTLFIVSLIAGALTVLAPCILPLLPVILGGAVAEAGNKRRPFIIIGSLSISVFAFTLLLKGSTAVITVSPSVWSYISAFIFLAFGLTLIFPEAWARLVLRIPGHNKPDRWIARGYGDQSSFWTDIIVGAALGPVFTTCSPTFFVILATVLPQSFAIGVIDLLAYIGGLALSLLLVSFIGQRLVDRLEWASDPNGWFKKCLGILFIVLALAIAFGWDKAIEADILHSGFFDVTTIEQSIHERLASVGSITTNGRISTSSNLLSDEGPYTEIVDPSGFVNSAPFKLADLIGKKVILVDFVDYSCINCERTFPYLNAWYSAYKDQGLEIVAIHTPEFSFEKDINNVQAAAQRFGLKFPIVLDNDYATWNAYGNEYWPHKYLIDIHGRVVYDHIGEGGYSETEAAIVQALNERKRFLGESGIVTTASSATTTLSYTVDADSPETYFGSNRNQTFGNGEPFISHTATFALPDQALAPDQFYLDGGWNIQPEYIENETAPAQISYIFTAAKAYMVASLDRSQGTSDPASEPVRIRVLIDGQPIAPAQSGTDVRDGILTIDGSRLYSIFSDTVAGKHRLDLIFQSLGVEAFTFTFG